MIMIPMNQYDDLALRVVQVGTAAVSGHLLSGLQYERLAGGPALYRWLRRRRACTLPYPPSGPRRRWATRVPSKSIPSTPSQSSTVHGRGCGIAAKQAQGLAAAAVASTAGAGTGPSDRGEEERPSQASCKREKRGRYGPGSIVGQSPSRCSGLVSIFASNHLAAN